jgi:DNA-binding CsgD family transcriptional regulator
MDILLKDNHFSLAHATEMSQICSILKIINIHFFHYIKHLKDGSQINLSNRPDWTQFFFNNGLYKIGAYGNNLRSGFIFWDYFEAKEIRTCVREFQLGQGITIIVKNKKECDFYCFGSSIRREEAVNFYLSNMDVLQRFIVYFNDKASSIINQALKTSQNRIILPEIYQKTTDPVTNAIVPFNYQSQEHYNTSKSSFVNTLNALRYKYQFSTNNYEVSLTPKELEYAIFLLQGKTAREIGEIFNVSRRTVETHFENLRNKLGCYSKQELILLLRKQLDCFWELTTN